MLLQITYQDKATQTDPDNENTIEKILNTMTLFHTKLDTMEKELQNIRSQQHDKKHAELSPSDDSKTPELEGDVGKHRKTQPNSLLNAATGASTSATKEETKARYVNTNMTKLFDKPFTPKIQKDIFMPPQVNTYKESLGQHKQAYNHITRAYIENIHKIQTFLNQNPRSTNTKNPHEDYITQHLQGYNKLIAQPGTNSNLVGTCYHYGLLNTVYTATGDEIAIIPELHKAFMHYKRITKGTLFYIKFYSKTAEILYDEIKPIIQRNKTGRYGRNKTVGIKPTKTRTKTDDKSYKAKLYLNRANGKLLQNYRTQISRPQLFKMLRRRQYHSKLPTWNRSTKKIARRQKQR
ncbi:hypothetical protein H5410_033328 [Solanum commersonii]|uniref:Uncharacterized protein n=1 Tax=Solanum commersonii TaxID=4109 RepID=A0A9J5YSS9_SOLCO|nr:hypothetical protein H5410_033328 [Solanum commersonii]